MWRNNNKNFNDELFMDALSDSSEGNDMQISDYESSENDSTVRPIRQNNRQILLSETEDYAVSSTSDMDKDSIINDDDNWSQNDIELQLEGYGRTSSVSTLRQDQENV
ncbi:hypothetical protein KM043_015931 [Ampulex compressa]|nr:hypothetical protein KM043_015931 [Ampulex compressa]